MLTNPFGVYKCTHTAENTEMSNWVKTVRRTDKHKITFGKV